MSATPETTRSDLTPPSSIERLRRTQRRLEMFSAFEAGLLLDEIDRLSAFAAAIASYEHLSDA